MKYPLDHNYFLMDSELVVLGETLPYASNALAAEVALVFILSGVEALRLCMGMY